MLKRDALVNCKIIKAHSVAVLAVIQATFTKGPTTSKIALKEKIEDGTKQLQR